jgi:hypothetical protein
MKTNIETTTFPQPPSLNLPRSPLLVFLENIELQLLDQLRDAELEWENICLARKLLRGPLKSVTVRKALERIARLADSEKF